MTIRIVLADDHPIVLEGVRRLLEQEPDLEITASCRDGEALLAAVQADRPDIVVLDMRMPGMNGMSVLRRAAEEKLDLRVVLLTAEISDDDTLEAVGYGVRGVVLKDTAPDVLVRCLRTVYAGGQWLEQQLTGRALERLLAREAARQKVARLLTPREHDLVRLVSQGMRNKEIAGVLGITEGTVKIHLHRIYDKLGVTNRVELVNFARAESM
jgi:DNA-binding NarL/FixJ family response regulator